MAVLSDVKLIEFVFDKKLTVDPFVLEHVQPSSIDLVLDKVIKVPKSGQVVEVTSSTEDCYESITVSERYNIKQNEVILGQTKELIGIPRTCMATVHNRSSLARLGLDVSLATYINPGYSGHLPLIIKNLGSFEIGLVPGMRICQIVVSEVSPEPIRDYSQRHDSKYFGEKDTLISKLHLDSEILAYLSKKKEKGEMDKDNRDLADFLNKRIDSLAKEISDKLADNLAKEYSGK